MPECSGLYNNKEGVRSDKVTCLVQEELAVGVMNFVYDFDFVKLDLAAGADSGTLRNLLVTDWLAHFETDFGVVLALSTKVQINLAGLFGTLLVLRRLGNLIFLQRNLTCLAIIFLLRGVTSCAGNADNQTFALFERRKSNIAFTGFSFFDRLGLSLHSEEAARHDFVHLHEALNFVIILSGLPVLHHFDDRTLFAWEDDVWNLCSLLQILNLILLLERSATLALSSTEVLDDHVDYFWVVVHQLVRQLCLKELWNHADKIHLLPRYLCF